MGESRLGAKRKLGPLPKNGHDVATKLRCLCLCKVEMSLGGIAGSVSRRRGDHHIGAAPASAGSFRLRFGGFSDLQGAVL